MVVTAEHEKKTSVRSKVDSNLHDLSLYPTLNYIPKKLGTVNFSNKIIKCLAHFKVIYIMHYDQIEKPNNILVQYI